jgi:hypothetical protein
MSESKAVRLTVSMVILLAVAALGLWAADVRPNAGHLPDAPKFYEVSAENGGVAYFQAALKGRVCLFRGPGGEKLSVENDGVYFPGFTLKFSQPGSSVGVRVFGSLIFHEQKQPMPMIYDIGGKYVSGIADSGEQEKDMLKRMRSEYNKLPDSFRQTMLAFFMYADRGPAEVGSSSAAVEEMVNQKPGAIKSHNVRTREIEDPKEAAKVQGFFSSN